MVLAIQKNPFLLSKLFIFSQQNEEAFSSGSKFPLNACGNVWEYFYWDGGIEVKYWTGKCQSMEKDIYQ